MVADHQGSRHQDGVNLHAASSAPRKLGRREFITLLGGTAIWPLAVRAQQPARTYRIGYLSGGAEAAQLHFLAPFRRRMDDLGYVDGKNFSIEARFAGGKFERLPSLVGELLGLNPDLLLVSTTPASLAAKAATSTTPIVMVEVADPVGVGLIASLARPGGNITGVTNISAELSGKRLEILKELVPAASKIAVFINPDDPIAGLQMRHAENAAPTLAIQLGPVFEIRSANDLRGVFEAAVRARADAALRMVDPTVAALGEQTVALAIEHRLAVMHPYRFAVDIGGLASYGASTPDQYRQVADYVRKIFSGAKPADLPVEQPTKFELVINLKTAKALGLTLPLSLLARADELIE
jgi:putative ABC transport system substrate-binding protein